MHIKYSILQGGNGKVNKVVTLQIQVNDKEHFFCEWIWMMIIIIFITVLESLNRICSMICKLSAPIR